MIPSRVTCLLLAAGCFAACPPARVDFGRDGEPRSAEELLKRVEAAETSVLTLSGEGKLFVDSPQGKGAVSIFTQVAHPSMVHLEQMDFFGKPQGVLTTDGEKFGLYDAQSGKYFQGPATPANLGRFLPLVMPGPELTSLLLGRAPRIHQESASMRFEPTTGLFTVTLTRGAIVQTLQVSPPSYRVISSSVVGLAAYDVEFGELANVGTVIFPRHVVLDAKGVRTRVEISWKDLTLNQAPDLTLFDFTAPEGVPVIDLDAAGVAK